MHIWAIKYCERFDLRKKTTVETLKTNMKDIQYKKINQQFSSRCFDFLPYRTLLYYIHFNFTLTALLTLVCQSGEIRDKKKENRLHKKAPLIIEGIIQMTIELQTNIW